MVKLTSGFPPYTLAFGINAVSLAKLVWPIARIDQYNDEANDQALLTEQEGREELREEADIKDLEYKRKFVRYHNNCVKAKGFKEGDLVLRNTRVMGINQTKGKLPPKWEGLYVIKVIVQIGTYHLAYEDGQEFA